VRTIIQTIGPLYGEIVNGTVFGQPNGSEARPIPNVAPSVTLSGDSGKLALVSSSAYFSKYTISGVTFDFVNAELIANNNAIVRNASNQTVARGVYPFQSNPVGDVANTPTNGDSLTLVVELYDERGNVIGTSNALTITAVVE
jgi:hypothetical protein